MVPVVKRARAVRGKYAMSRLLFATVFWTLGFAQAAAQSEVSQRLLELEDDERNAAFTLILKDSNRKCDQVIRTSLKAPSWVWTSGRRCVETETLTRLACLHRGTRRSSMR